MTAEPFLHHYKAWGIIKAHMKCYNTLNNLAENRGVELLWISGHSGFRGNEIINYLPRLGAEQRVMCPEPAVGISYPYINELFRLWEERRKTLAWVEAEGFRQAYALISVE